MKTIAAAATAFMMLTATAWADAPIQLNDLEMDGVTAGSSSDDAFYISIDYGTGCAGCSAGSAVKNIQQKLNQAASTGGGTNATSTGNNAGEFWFGGLQAGTYQ